MRLIHGDCLVELPKLAKRGVVVDAVLCDPPYGVTIGKWDSVIHFESLWECIRGVRSDRCPIVLFGIEPFSSLLRLSNIKEFKYDWIWDKRLTTGHLNSKKMPLRRHEILSVFGRGRIPYYPIMWEGAPLHSEGTKRSDSNNRAYSTETRNYRDRKGSTSKYPVSILRGIDKVHASVCSHPQEKPVALMEYLIKTYTKEGDTVLDFSMGSGTTGVACKGLNRQFIGIEIDYDAYLIAKERIRGKR